ncbi:hypothetical protein M3685_11205 [Heyndrickxia oleronia]|uniref:hypothetical protein n=1 Tax=Heyndrickxia oleronia TaxID=38875 RepID=UPI00203AEBC0|nr:hypothetical protein [Heyndrickxia oleronia]MCM3454511.1 hypothetical protein [Heyndrickxia oleronia]
MEIRTQKLENKRVKHMIRWHSWIGYAALFWSVLYGIINFYWLQGGEGYPFIQESGTGIFSALFTYLPVQAGSIIFCVLCIFGLFISLAMYRPWGRMVPHWLIILFSWTFAVFLLLFIPDFRLIAAIAYAFLFKFAFSWQMLNQIICIIGALLWIFAVISYQRKVRNACRDCGRRENGKPSVLIRWGNWITIIAAIAPVPYAVTRIAWALGVPLGVDPQFLEESVKVNPNAILTEWVFGGLCVGGGFLTIGLIQKWGEVFPRWVPFIGRKRVPVMMAVIPAFIVAIALTTAGFIFTLGFFAIKLQVVPAEGIVLSEMGGTIGPMLSWMPWGLALGLAAISYYYRRRGKCEYCLRGDK